MHSQTTLLNQPQSQYMLQQQINSINNFSNQQYFQEPYLSIPIPTNYMPPYYGIAPAHNMMYHQIHQQQQQQQQQQQLGTSPSTMNSGLPPPPPPLPPTLINKQNGRPISPQNQENQYQNQSNFSYYPNYASFDPSSAAAQLLMPNQRNLNSGVRLISPMLMNASGNQSSQS